MCRAVPQSSSLVYNPTDTCCEICLLCAESAPKKSVKSRPMLRPRFTAGCSQYDRQAVYLLEDFLELMRFGYEIIAPKLTIADFPFLCLARRNMALIHPTVVILFLLSPVGWGSTGSQPMGPGTCRGLSRKTKYSVNIVKAHFN